MATIKLWPGSMGLVKEAIDLFGLDRVRPGSWLTPVYVTDITADEVAFAKEFFTEIDISVEEVAEHEVLR